MTFKESIKNSDIMKKKRKDLIITACFSATVLLLSLIPNLGFIKIGPVSFTIIHIPVLLSVMFLPFLESLFVGFVFGISSLMAAFLYGTALDVPFQNPAISVLPRMIFAEFAWGIKYLFLGIEKKFSPKKSKIPLLLISSVIIGVICFLIPYFLPVKPVIKDILYIVFAILGFGFIFISSYFYYKNPKREVSISLVSIFASMFHTLVVLLYLYLIHPEGIMSYAWLISVVISTNGIIEIFLAGIVVPIIYYSVRKFYKE